MTKLNFSYKETGRLTLSLFNKLYQYYKDDFDLELQLRLSGTTYSNLKKKQEKQERWI